MAELLYNNLVRRADSVTLYRGETKKYTFVHNVNAADIQEAELTVRETVDGDEVFRISEDEYPAQWTHSDGSSTVLIVPENSEDKTAGNYYFDVQFTLIYTDDAGNNVVHSPVSGRWSIEGDVTYDSGSSTALTRGTRTGFETSLTALEDFESDMLTLFNATRLAADAASGAGTITVDSVTSANLSAGDNFYLTLDDGTREAHDVAAGGISGNVVTLGSGGAGATLGGDASSGNVLRKVP